MKLITSVSKPTLQLLFFSCFLSIGFVASAQVVPPPPPDGGNLSGTFKRTTFLQKANSPFRGVGGKDRPKVGLVLSGGGAKGYAHVGALKVIEEAGIKIDYISGTSMGAIIGGLYASGWTAHQLDSILRNTNLADIMQDNLPREILPIFEKEYGEKYALSLSVSDFKIALPSAISSGQTAFNFFSRLTHHATGTRDFDQLPIPFVCIGTDAECGQEIVFESGNLAKAVRASGSFPGLILPYKVDECTVMDGGIVNNFPAEILREKGMDIVIGVNVESGLYTSDELRGIDKIIDQVSSFQMVQNSLAQLDFCDVVIYPDIEGFGVSSFGAVDTLIQRGEDAARSNFKDLDWIAEKQGRIAQYHPLPLRPQLDSFYVDKLRIINDNTFSKANILEFFPKGLKGWVHEDDFYDGVTNLFGSGAVKYVDFSFRKRDNGNYDLELRPIAKEGFDKQLRVGLHYDNVYKSNLLVNLTLINLGLNNSTFSSNLILGDGFRYNINYLVDMGTMPDIGFNSRLDFNEVPSEMQVLFPGDSTFRRARFNFDYTDFSNELYYRIFSSNRYSAGLAAEGKYFSTATDQLIDEEENEFIGEKGVYFVGSAYFNYDTRDDRNFPERGLYSTARFRNIYPLSSQIFDGSERKRSLNLDYSFLKVIPLSGNASLGISGDLGLTLGPTAPPYVYFLGGNNRNFINNFKPMEGLSFAERFGSDLLRTSVYGQLRPLKNQYIQVGFHFALLGDGLINTLNSQAIQSAYVGYGIKTPLGPIGVSYATSTEGNEWYFNLGYWF